MRISAPGGFRRGGNDEWDHCALCGDRLWPGASLADYEGKQYCSGHLAAKLADVIDTSSWDLSEDRGSD